MQKVYDNRPADQGAGYREEGPRSRTRKDPDIKQQDQARDQRTRTGTRDQRTKGPEDQETRAEPGLGQTV